MKQGLFIIFFLVRSIALDAQTLGGNSVFNFLRLSNTPQLTALGGENITNQTDDIGMAFHSPSLLRETMHTQASFVFNSFYGGIKNYHLQAGYRSERWKTNFALGVMYFDYGNVNQADASGNLMGDFRPRDYVAQLSMSRNYLSRWVYGASIKYIGSVYGAYSSSGLAVDLGLSYFDTANGIQSSFVIKNIGTQLSTYAGTSKEELPFDLQVGISKRLKNAPLQFSLTVNRLHRFDVTYNDSVYNNENGLEQQTKSFSLDNIFRHIILATQVYITDKVEVSLGYNYLRRKELNIGESGNGLNGFSAGAGVLFKKMQLRYGQAYYQGSRPYHQIGINLKFNEFSAFGKL